MTDAKNPTGKPPGRGPLAGEELSSRMKRFCDEYVVDFNGRRAAKRAGYADSTNGSLRVQAARLLKNAAVQGYLAEIQQAMDAEREMRRQRIIDELERIAFFNVDDVLDMFGSVDLELVDEDERRDLLAAVVSREFDQYGRVKWKFADKARALELLAKMEGMIIDRKQISGPRGGPVPVATTEMTPNEAAALWAECIADT